MGACIEIARADQLQTACRPRDSNGVAPLTAEQFTRDRPTRHVMLVHDGRHLARASIWTGPGPLYRDRPAAVLGHYAACDPAAGRTLLTDVCRRLSEHGQTCVLGPMDGNTWRRYRLIVERGSERAFFFEPEHPPDWPDHFTAAGFEPIATYTSAMADDLTRTDPRLEPVARRLNQLGVTIRPIAIDRFEAELAAIHDLCLTAFANNFLYTPIDRNAFMQLYLPVRPHVQAEMVLVAERAGQPVGFVFAMPDLAQAQRGDAIDQAIIKTVAILPERAYAGLGGLLVQRAQKAACSLGYRRAVHALMFEGNRSRGISARYAHVFRRYALFGRDLSR